MEPIAENAVDKREEIKNKLRESFDGKIVRKDLTKKIKGRGECAGVCAGVPSWSVLQFG